jgi:hypothetical protein
MLVKVLALITLLKTAAAFDYCTISAQNTMCKYKVTLTYFILNQLSLNLMVWLFVVFCQTTDIGKACMKVFPMSLTNADKATILDVHNKLRRQVAQGTETRGSPGPQPSASNMRQLKWDDELAQMAQTLVQQCVFGHDANRNVGNYICHNFAKSLGTSNSWKLSLAWL